jgi:hypothetical protein
MPDMDTADGDIGEHECFGDCTRERRLELRDAFVVSANSEIVYRRASVQALPIGIPPLVR